MSLLVFIIVLVSSSLAAEERIQNPCFSYSSGYDKEACDVCLEYAARQAETECRTEADFADEIFDDVIYASSDEYPVVYKEWRTRINARDQCKVDLIIECLEN